MGDDIFVECNFVQSFKNHFKAPQSVRVEQLLQLPQLLSLDSFGFSLKGKLTQRRIGPEKPKYRRDLICKKKVHFKLFPGCQSPKTLNGPDQVVAWGKDVRGWKFCFHWNSHSLKIVEVHISKIAFLLSGDEPILAYKPFYFWVIIHIFWGIIHLDIWWKWNQILVKVNFSEMGPYPSFSRGRFQTPSLFTAYLCV